VCIDRITFDGQAEFESIQLHTLQFLRHFVDKTGLFQVPATLEETYHVPDVAKIKTKQKL
jgi:hypothetical protein